MTVQYARAVRNNTPQNINYTFKDQNNAIIDLTSYVSVSLEIKLQGQVYATIAGSFISKPNGQVQTAAPYTFTQVGTWDIQFIAKDGSNNELFGEPMQLVVVPNVEDLALAQLSQY